MSDIIGVFHQTLMITGFVFVMMLVIEYINIITGGAWQQRLMESRWSQYFFAVLLGAIPGCLGAFIIVAMYSHRIVTLGAVVGAMIATSGDEAFVMLALIPGDALLLTALLFIIGITAAFFTDLFSGQYKTKKKEICEGFQLHTFTECNCFPGKQILEYWKHRSPFRIVLTVILGLFIISVVTGSVGPPVWNWVRVSILTVTTFALFIVVTVPDHFLEEHLWNHVARKHVPRIFFWTLGALLVLHLIVNQLNLESLIRENKWIVLAVASLVGIIPESGPHLLFVTLYDNGTVPFSILLASSIVQDGHGMLPLLAHSRATFLLVKLINFIVGILFGMIFLLLGL
ncbi:MAG: arsenic efflux protein [Calditrichaeota bacterium]|nr:arsenic efflux protein [Calditrichota bacterium]